MSPLTLVQQFKALLLHFNFLTINCLWGTCFPQKLAPAIRFSALQMAMAAREDSAGTSTAGSV
jgi:hypothetical protein